MSFDLRCHRCSSWMGESPEPMELVGLFRDPRERRVIELPRGTWRCKSCGWANVFIPVNRSQSDWRGIDTKKESLDAVRR